MLFLFIFWGGCCVASGASNRSPKERTIWLVVKNNVADDMGVFVVSTHILTPENLMNASELEYHPGLALQTSCQLRRYIYW